MKNESPFRPSIFLSILLPILLALILIPVLVTMSLRPHLFGGPPKGRHPGPPMFHEQLGAILDGVKANPNLESFRAGAAKQGYDALVDIPGARWESAPALPEWNELFSETDEKEVRGFAKGRPYQAVRGDFGRIAILAPHHDPPSPLGRPHFWFSLFVQLAVVLLFAYLVLVWQLRPLRTLDRGVQELAKGNLAHRLPVKGGRELAHLSAAFNEMAEKISRMLHAKEELLLGVSHELRSPIASLKVAVEMLDDERRKGQMKLYLSQMESMVTELLESHRIASAHSQVHRENIDAEGLLASLAKRYEGAALPVVVKTEPKGLSISADSRLLERLLGNLVDNAIKYSKDSGKPVEVTASKTGSGVRIDVIDHGPGIPDMDVPHVFEAFYRVDKSRNKETGGFGLGLSLCKKIAEAHGGTLTVTTTLGKGCVFTLTLPVYNS